MTPFYLTVKQARRFILRHQGLLPARTATGKEGVQELLSRIGCIQFDPLDVVGRNPDLVLQSRIDNYNHTLLEEMLYTDRSLLDGWDKKASIYRVEDRPYFIYRQNEAAEHAPWNNNNHVKNAVINIRAELEARGPLSSIDLTDNNKVEWSWGPTRAAKVALEHMYSRGELIIHHKLGTRKIYDLAARHLPAAILNAPDPHTSMADYQDWHVLRRIRGVGLAWNRSSTMWHGIYSRHGNQERTAALSRLLERGDVSEVRVTGLQYPFYMATRDLSELENVNTSFNAQTSAAIIAPLDNLLWDRDMVRALFEFDYTWEVYKPPKERRYGYYVLPVLFDDRFIARFEPSFNSKTRTLTVKNWWWEPGTTPTTGVRSALRDCFECFAVFLGAKDIKVNKPTTDHEKLDWLP